MGRPPSYVSQRLLSLAVRNWPEYHGDMLRQGVFPTELPFPWFLDTIYAWAVADASRKERALFDEKLHAPPAHDEIDEDDEIWSDDATFELFMNQAGSK